MYQVRINENIMIETRNFSLFHFKQNQIKENFPSECNLASIFVILILIFFQSERVYALGETLPVEISVKQSDAYVTINHEKISDYSIKRQQFHKGRVIQAQPQSIKMFSIEGDGHKEIFMIQTDDDSNEQISDGIYSEKVTVTVKPREYKNNDKPMVYDRWLYYQVDNGSVKYMTPQQYSKRVDPTYYEKNSLGKLQAYKKGAGIAIPSNAVNSEPKLDVRVDTKPVLINKRAFQFTTRKVIDRSEVLER